MIVILFLHSTVLYALCVYHAPMAYSTMKPAQFENEAKQQQQQATHDEKWRERIQQQQLNVNTALQHFLAHLPYRNILKIAKDTQPMDSLDGFSVQFLLHGRINSSIFIHFHSDRHGAWKTSHFFAVSELLCFYFVCVANAMFSSFVLSVHNSLHWHK